MRLKASFASVLVLAGCPTAGGPEAECAGPADCAEPEPAPCEACAPIATELCVDGACVAREENAVDVSVANLLIARDVDGVNGLRFAVVIDAPCADVASLGPSVNALASGQKTLSGGDLHQDVALGRVPEGTVALVLEATSEIAGQGSVLARACTAGLAATAPTLVVENITLEP